MEFKKFLRYFPQGPHISKEAAKHFLEDLGEAPRKGLFLLAAVHDPRHDFSNHECISLGQLENITKRKF